MHKHKRALFYYLYIDNHSGKHETRPNVGLILNQRRRPWPNIKPTLGQRLVFARTLRLPLLLHELLRWLNVETTSVSLLWHRKNAAIFPADINLLFQFVLIHYVSTTRGRMRVYGYFWQRPYSKASVGDRYRFRRTAVTGLFSDGQLLLFAAWFVWVDRWGMCHVVNKGIQ